MSSIVLNTPIKMGEKQITEITLREPMAGELIGIKVADLLQMDVTAHSQLVPRISDPVISTELYNKLPLDDLLSFMTEVVSFFVKGRFPMT